MVLIAVDTPRGRETGVPGPGEAWGGAALRLAAGEAVAPTAGDLSGDPAVFQVDPDRRLHLRLATPGDLPNLVRWRQQPHVHRWWACDGEPTRERVSAQYLPDITGDTPDTLWIAELNGRSIGFLSDYLLSDHPDYALLTPDPAAIGVDYAIGESAWTGRGLGAALIWTWLGTIRARHPEVLHAFAAPDHRNRPSVRVLERAGFTQGVWFDAPQPDGTVSTVVGCTASLSSLVG